MRVGKHLFVFVLLAIGFGVGCYAQPTIKEGPGGVRPTWFGKNPILQAILSGDLTRVKELIVTGKFSVNDKIDLAERKGYVHTSTALIEAAKANKFDIVKYLVVRGADVNESDYEKLEMVPNAVPAMHSALDYAKQNKNQEMIKFLQDHGAE